ncbi:hypothetical protein H7K14_21410 [Mycolicibacter longobardus]|uniref:Uncharacterized protein n=1 Tax=Mycolicibacter longobardus TaxID=1108812 RepID=A0A1X1YCP5_9MYCO|nr:hypothetical protein [Mycolicibacter longobardus]ORW08863.1 hypothetical protein AWC16_18550 [Mycolicibacter longobardus]
MLESVSGRFGWRSAAGIFAATLVLAPAAAADPECSSCEQGKEAIDDQVLHRHVPLTATDDLHQYCESLLRNVLKSGRVARVDSPPDFVASCEQEGRVLIAGR